MFDVVPLLVNIFSATQLFAKMACCLKKVMGRNGMSLILKTFSGCTFRRSQKVL